MKHKLKYFILPISLFLVYTACVKKKTYSDSPEIAYKSFTPFPKDSAALAITFSDGNGDIGKEEGDTTKNVFLKYYYKDTVSLKYVSYDSIYPPVVPNNFTIRKPKDSYLGKPISGEVSIAISKFRPSSKLKAFKYSKYVMYIIDNAGHKSNVLTTPELYVP